MTTPSFGLTATERVLPKLALDFTTASLDSRVTFTRTTGASNPATYVNSSGVITAATNNQPRFDYDPVTLACKGLLIEESRSNIAIRSNEFDNTGTWPVSRVGMAATGSSGTSPDGTNNAYKLNEDTGSLTKIISQAITATNVVNTFSVYVKAAGRTNIELAIIGTSNYGAAYDLTALTVGTNVAGFTQATSASITDAGDGWRRCTITQNAAAGTALTCRIYLSTGAAVNYTGNGTSGVLLYGAQLEAGAFATSYIPTTTAALTRNADVATMTGTNFSDWFNATEGAAVIQTIPRAAIGTSPAIQFDDNTANEIITLRGSVADPQLYVVDGGSAQATLDAGTITANTAYKLCGAWKASSFAVSINGGAAVAQASGTLPTVTQARLGGDGTNYLNGWLQNLRYWPQRLTNAEVQAFSK